MDACTMGFFFFFAFFFFNRLYFWDKLKPGIINNKEKLPAVGSKRTLLLLLPPLILNYEDI
jgi:hypothetical protein